MTATHIIRAKVMHDKRTYRDIEILSGKTLVALADAILDAFEFGDKGHLFGFFGSLGRNHYDSQIRYELSPDPGSAWMGMGSRPKSKSAKQAIINQVLTEKKQKMQFVFDYGDEWRFEVEVREFGDEENGVKYPRILASKGAPPEQYPEDDGGEW